MQMAFDHFYQIGEDNSVIIKASQSSIGGYCSGTVLHGDYDSNIKVF